MRAFLIILFNVVLVEALQYVSHVFRFPSIPYSTGIYHIHSPSYFIEAHGFALPGFEIYNVKKPIVIKNYIATDFDYKTLFDQGTARVFSEQLNTSRVLLMDTHGNPSVCGSLCLQNSNGKSTLIAKGDLLRPHTPWEEIMQCRVVEWNVKEAIVSGYTNFKTDMNLKLYMNMILERN
jgi:hypothetical protein